MKKGISLLILVLTVMVLSIITTTVVLNFESNNTINDSKAAVFLKDAKDLYAEFKLNFVNQTWKCRKCGRYYLGKKPAECIYELKEGEMCKGTIFDKVTSLNEINLINADDMKLFIPDFPPQYNGKLVILNGEICAVRANLSEEVIKKIEETKALKLIDNIDPNHKNMHPKIPKGFKHVNSPYNKKDFIIEKDGVTFSWIEVSKDNLEKIYNDQGMTAKVCKSIEENKGFYMSIKDYEKDTIEGLLTYANNLVKDNNYAMTMVPTGGMYSLLKEIRVNGSYIYNKQFELTLEKDANNDYIFYKVENRYSSTNPAKKYVRPALILL